VAEFVLQNDVVKFRRDRFDVRWDVHDAGRRLELGAAEDGIVVTPRSRHPIAEEGAGPATANALDLTEGDVDDHGLGQERTAGILGRRQAGLHDLAEFVPLALRLHREGRTGNENEAQGDEQITHIQPRQQLRHALGAGKALRGFDKVTFSYKLRIFSVKF